MAIRRGRTRYNTSPMMISKLYLLGHQALTALHLPRQNIACWNRTLGSQPATFGP